MYDACQFTLTPSEYRAALYATCEDLGAAGKDSIFGWGRVDAYAAVVNVGTPRAYASASPRGGQAPLSVSFSGSSNMDDLKTLTYTWDFGDGNSATGRTAGHTYTVIGTYTVTLTVEDSDGLSGTDTLTVTVTYGNVPETMYMWQGQRVNYLFAPAGGANPATVSLGSGSLPPGTSLAGNRLSGTARRKGSWKFSVTIDDGVNTPTSRTVRVYVTEKGFGRFRKYTWR
jgi:PKD repeat protein